MSLEEEYRQFLMSLELPDDVIKVEMIWLRMQPSGTARCIIDNATYIRSKESEGA